MAPNRKTYTFATPDPLREAIKGLGAAHQGSAPDLVHIAYSPIPPTDISVADDYLYASDIWSGIDSIYAGLVEYPQHEQYIYLTPNPGAFIDSDERHKYATDYADAAGPFTGMSSQLYWLAAYIYGQQEYDELYPSITGKTFEEWVTEMIAQVDGVTNDGKPGFKNLKFINEIPHVTKDFSLTTNPVVFDQQLVPTVNQEFILNFTGNPVIDRKYEQAASSDAISELQLLNFYEKNAMVTDAPQMEIYIDNYLVPGVTPDTRWENLIVPYYNFEELMGLNNVYREDWPVEAITNPGLVHWDYQSSRLFRNAIGQQDLDLALINTIMLYTEAESAATSKSDLQTRLGNITWNHLGLEQSLDIETLDVVHESYIEYSTFGTPLASPEAVVVNSTVNVALLNLDPWAQNISDLMEAARWTGTPYHSYPLVGGYANNSPILNNSYNIVYDSNFDIATINAYAEDFIETVTDTLMNSGYGVYPNSPGVLEYIKSYEELIEQSSDYSEVILYKIEKRSDPNSLIPLQTFWIQSGWGVSGPPAGSPIQFIDTQVKFGKNYFYRVFAYNVVVGTRYSYSYLYPADYLAQATTIPPDEDYCPEAPTGWAGIAYAAIFEPHYHNIYSWATGRAVVPSSNFGGYSLATFDHDHHFDGATTPNQDPASTTAWNGDSGDIILDAASLQLFLSIQAGTTTVSGYGGAVQLTGRTMGVNVSSTGGGAVVDHYHRVSISVGDQSLPGDGATDMDDICHGTWGSGETTIPAGTTSILHKKSQAPFRVVTAPTVQLIQTHLFDFNGAVLSLPPTAPDVFFIPYIGIDNKITLSMHAQLGEYQKEAVILDSADADYIDLLRTSHGLSPTDPITYKTDDEVAGFEIYRTETKPSTYEDFSGKFRNSISTLQRSSFQYVYAWDTAYKDEIVPNKVYYYMVRTVDIHGQKSYPSAVFQVQMVNDSGAIYPLIEVIDLVPPPKPQSKTKNFKKFLQLVPSIAQRMINYDESGLTDSAGRIVNSAVGKHTGIVLGVKNPSLFGGYYSSAVVGGADHAQYIPSKRLKIRLISKQTGKKIDLNVAFKVENE